MRFKIDQNLPVEIADALRAGSHEADTVYEEQLAGIPDRELGEVVRSERRALVTLDLGFADLRTYPPADYHGFVVLRPPDQAKATVLRVFTRVIPLLTTEPLAGRLWIVEERRVRIRER